MSKDFRGAKDFPCILVVASLAVSATDRLVQPVSKMTSCVSNATLNYDIFLIRRSHNLLRINQSIKVCQKATPTTKFDKKASMQMFQNVGQTETWKIHNNPATAHARLQDCSE